MNDLDGAPPPVSSTRSRINEHLISINADLNFAFRPTEAQLRWWTFQRAELVRDTRARVDRLMRHPERVRDVPGAYPSDGESSTDEETNEVNEVSDIQTNKKGYLGMRRDGQGRWTRRHFSQKRFPLLAKSVPPSPSCGVQPTAAGDANNVQPKNRSGKKKVHISRGRRALLRVSARAFDERKRQQQQNSASAFTARRRRSPVPYEFTQELPSVSESHSYTEPLHPTALQSISEKITLTKSKRKTKKHKVVFENTSNLDSIRLDEKLSTMILEDEISSLFTNHSDSRLRNRHPPESPSAITSDEEERIRRFEEAYRAILSHTVDHDCEATIISSEWVNSGSKRWTRGNVSSAISVDGRSYEDLQRTPTVSSREMGMVDYGILKCKEPLFDRGATWMVHVPKIKNKFENGQEFLPSHGKGGQLDKNRNIFLSQCQKKLNDIEQSVQRSVSHTKFSLAENRKAVAQDQEGLMGQCVLKQLQGKMSQSDTITIGSSTKIPHTGSQMVNASNPTIDTLRRGPNQSRPTEDVTDDNQKYLGNDTTEPSTVRTSTLRLLFSGISEPPVSSKNYSKASTLRTDKAKVSGMRAKFEQCQDSPIDSKIPHSDPIVSIGKFGKISTSSSFYERVSNIFVTTNDNDFSFNTIDNEHNTDKNCTDARTGNNDVLQNTSPTKLTLQNLDVTDLVRHSLSQRVDALVIDTDGTSTDVTGGYDQEQYMDKMGTLLMSPALITRRYRQALETIELHNWDQVFYLINADPWLMEMKDLRNDQYLVHVLALFGAGQHDEDEGSEPAPRELIEAMLDHDPSVAHKLDNEGNLPLHMAAASGNITMIRELGSRFPGAASVQNHDGLLPLHLAIMSCALFPTGEYAVSLILALFHGGVCIKDNDGNTPLHTAARSLKGDVGVDVIHQLMTVCNKLAHDNPLHLRESMGRNVKKAKQFDDSATMITTMTEPVTDTSGFEDSVPGSLFCLAKNNDGDTSLARAIKSLAGWQVIEALLSMDGGHLAVLERNSAAQNALHLALEIDLNDASVVLAILKASPSSAPVPDGSGVHPIQLACMNCLQREIILAIAIIDLPIDLGARQEAIFRNGFGASWWFLVCESDDRYVDIVTEILSMCSHPQKTALCLTRASPHGTNKAVISCASPRCKMAIMGSLRFLGRFEFTGDEKKSDASSEFIQQFSAIDFGTHENSFKNGRKVSLRCYMNDIEFTKQTCHLNQVPLPELLFEELDFFSLMENEPNAPHDIRVKHCVSTSMPSMSLARVVTGMPKNHKYRRDTKSLRRYFGKVKHILLQTAKALSHLHENGIVHCFVDSHHIGKFGDSWKITGLLGSIANKSKVDFCRTDFNYSPEAVSSNDSLTASPSLDIWSFGKLMYEVLVGESLFAPFEKEGDVRMILLTWNERHQSTIADELFGARIGSNGIDLITTCLSTRIQDRPGSMTLVLQHPFWHDIHAFNTD